MRVSIFPFLHLAIQKEGDEMIQDLLERSATGITVNLFTSREAESQLKIQILRRLGVVALCVSPVSLQTFWPSIQERIVDLLKSSSGVTLMHVFIFIRCCLYGLSDNSIISLVSLLHPTIMDTLSSVLETSDLSEEMLYQLTGVFCYLDCIFLLHRHIAVSYLWGICSPITTDGILKDIADKHQIFCPDRLIMDPFNYIIPTRKPKDLQGFAPFLYGLQIRTAQYSQSDKLPKAELDRLTLRAIQEMP